MTTPDLSVITLTYRSREDLRRNLLAQRRFRPRCRFEILVVNNSPEDDVAVLAEFADLPIRQVGDGANLGVAAGKNLGARHARGRYLYCLDADAEVRRGSLDAVVDFLDAHPDIWGLSPRTLDAAGEVETGYYAFPRLSHVLALRLAPRRFWRRSRGGGGRRPPGVRADRVVRYDRVQDIDWISGHAFVFRRDRFRQLGGFDERFFFAYDEPDLCRRARAVGGRFVALPWGTIIHHGHHSTRKSPAFARLWNTVSLQRYLGKHHRGLVSALAFCLLLLSVLGKSVGIALLGRLGGDKARTWAAEEAKVTRVLWRYLREGDRAVPRGSV